MKRACKQSKAAAGIDNPLGVLGGGRCQMTPAASTEAYYCRHVICVPDACVLVQVMQCEPAGPTCEKRLLTASSRA